MATPVWCLSAQHQADANAYHHFETFGGASLRLDIRYRGQISRRDTNIMYIVSIGGSWWCFNEVMVF